MYNVKMNWKINLKCETLLENEIRTQTWPV